MALIAELQPVAFSPFSRILSTVSFQLGLCGRFGGQPFKNVAVPRNRGW